MPKYHFIQADVFTDKPFGGNQLAVFTDARGLTTEQMQTLTREMNYSESTFVLPPEMPGTDMRVRIFTPAIEMPMAGHPTVGTTFVLAQSGALAGKEATLQLKIGPIKVEIERNSAGEPQFVWMTHNAPKFGAIRTDRERVAAALGVTVADLHADLPIQHVTTGVPFLMIPLRSLQAIGRCKVNQSALAELFVGEPESAGAYLFTTETTGPHAHLHARMFAPHIFDIPEDPATGSAAAPMAAYAVYYGLVPEGRFLIEQGVEMGRPSQIHVIARRAGENFTELKIGGQTTIVGEGYIFW
jgi:trans-2,3-dihydro-3-hydroxyanthranilate isomerase